MLLALAIIFLLPALTWGDCSQNSQLATRALVKAPGIEVRALNEKKEAYFGRTLVPTMETKSLRFAQRLARRISSIMAVFPSPLLQRLDLCFIIVEALEGYGPDGINAAGLTYQKEIVLPLGTYTATIYHEFFHALDLNLNGSSQHSNWLKHVPGGLQAYHRKGGASFSHMRLRMVKGGFVSPYAQSTILEDRAETFAAMMMDFRGLSKVADKSLKNKIGLIQEFLASLDPDLDQQFWNTRTFDEDIQGITVECELQLGEGNCGK